jgi:hypothetical protein
LTAEINKKTFQSVIATLHKYHNTLLVKKEIHSEYLTASLHKMGKSIFGYDVGHPWLLYYISNTLYILNSEGYELDKSDK